MTKKILIDAKYSKDIRVALIDENKIIEDFEYETSHKTQIKGNIYLARVVKVEPSLQAVFINYAENKSGFIPFYAIQPNYFNVPEGNQLGHLKSITLQKTHIEEAESDLSNINDISIDNIENLLKKEPDINLNAEEENSIKQKEDNNKHEGYKIQDVIKKGQTLLVQAVKEERGNKSPFFTTNISLVGKYCILIPNVENHHGISKKISSSSERKRLKKIIDHLINSNFSLIVRTAGFGKSFYEIQRDYEYLVNLWNRILDVALRANIPSFIYMEDDIINKSIRDMFSRETSEILIQGRGAYKKAVDFMKNMMPTEVHKIKEYREHRSIFAAFNIEQQILNLYQPVVKLPSGGSIIINPTESLTAIDVNSGKSTSDQNINDSTLKINIEAAKEISKQLKLRDISGLVVIDFIDMISAESRKVIEAVMQKSLYKDSARIQINGINALGLLELSRQRLRNSFLESNSSICSHCNGKGVIRSDESNAMVILRAVENELVNSPKIDMLSILGHEKSISYLLNEKRNEITLLEKQYDVLLKFYQTHQNSFDAFSIEKIKLSKRQIPKPAKSIVNNLDCFSEQKNAPRDKRIKILKKPQYNKKPNQKESILKKIIKFIT